jgi:hypothetical protein
MMTAAAFAGTPQKWDKVPEAVRKTVLGNGGTPESRVDLEGKPEIEALINIFKTSNIL